MDDLDKAFKYTAVALNILEKLLHSKFTVDGVSNLPKDPILFVANHFTRSETFFMPYLINKYSSREVRCLADSSLFHGILGKFLNSVGAVSTKQEHRDNIIIKDLITGRHDWMIYPEGSMIKSKEITQGSHFVNHTPSRIGKVRTGATILGLKSELYRSEMTEAFERGDKNTLDVFKKDLNIEYFESLKNLNTYIVPINITYYPIRGGDNALKKLINRLVKAIPKNIAEEIEIESNLLLNSEINIFFGEPINLGEYVEKAKRLIYQIPIIKKETKVNFVLRYFKHNLTNRFMKDVYLNIQINFDHIFSASLYCSHDEIVDLDHFKRVIYISSLMINKVGRYRVNDSILEKNLFKIFIDEDHKEFDSAFDLAISSGIINNLPNGKIKINKVRLQERSDFDYIRLENTLQVILNEFLLLDSAVGIVRRIADTDYDILKNKVKLAIFKSDIDNFEEEYNKFSEEKDIKDKSIGSPIFLNSKIKAPLKVKSIGVIVCHGYKSSPREVEELAKYVNGFGFQVYCPRLSGHGTASVSMKYTSFEDWYSSVQRAYAALRNSCTKIVLVGFSTGGLLSLLSIARKNKNHHLASIVSINAALKIHDIRAKFASTINFWNEILDKFNVEKAKFEYIEDQPENPTFNYSRNYVHGVKELQELMHQCNKNLDKIDIPILIIQANKDPVVNPISGKMLFDGVTSRKKQLLTLDFSNHVIINSDGKEEVFASIGKFLKEN